MLHYCSQYFTNLATIFAQHYRKPSIRTNHTPASRLGTGGPGTPSPRGRSPAEACWRLLNILLQLLKSCHLPTCPTMFLVVFFLHRSALASEPKHRSRSGRPLEGGTEDWLCLPNSPAMEENRATGHAQPQHQVQHETDQKKKKKSLRSTSLTSQRKRLTTFWFKSKDEPMLTNATDSMKQQPKQRATREPEM